MTVVMLAATAPKRAQMVHIAGTKSIWSQAAVSLREYREKSPILHAMVDHVPMHAVTAEKKAYHPSRPCSLGASRITSPARSPASWIVQAIMARATMGSVTALMRKIGRNLRGWMSVKGNWNTQNKKKQSMLDESTPADSGSVFVRLANEGQMAVRQILTPVPPW